MNRRILEIYKYTHVYPTLKLHRQLISTLPKNVKFTVDPLIDDHVSKNGKNKEFRFTNFKDHFGRVKLDSIKTPSILEEAIENVLATYPETNIKEDAKELNNLILNRRLPTENDEKWELKQQLIENMRKDESLMRILWKTN